MTDSPDPLTIKHLGIKEADSLRDNPKKFGELIEQLSPFIFIVIGVGIVYWDGQYSQLDHAITQTAVLAPIQQLSEWVRKDPGCLIPLRAVSPAQSRQNQNEIGSLLATFAAAHAACSDLASLAPRLPSGQPNDRRPRADTCGEGAETYPFEPV